MQTACFCVCVSHLILQEVRDGEVFGTETPLFAPFYTKNDNFTKTGAGQT